MTIPACKLGVNASENKVRISKVYIQQKFNVDVEGYQNDKKKELDTNFLKSFK